VHLVEVLVEEHGDLKERARQAALPDPHPAVPLQAEEDAKALLAPPRRPQLDQEVRDARPSVLQAVRGARRDDEALAGMERPALTADPEAEAAGDALEALPLAGVNMRLHEAARADEELAGDAIGGPHPEDDALAGDRIMNGVRCVDRLI
jgi:hypothetical protein